MLLYLYINQLSFTIVWLKFFSTSSMRISLLFFLILSVFSSCSSKKTVTSDLENKNIGRKKMVTSVVISSVTIESFPKYSPTGEKWDPLAPFSTDPDLFVLVKWNDKTIYKSETREDCTHGKQVPFSVGIPFEINPFDQTLTLEVFDEDSISKNDNVGYFSINLLDYKGQREIKLQDAKGELVLVLGVKWTY